MVPTAALSSGALLEYHFPLQADNDLDALDDHWKIEEESYSFEVSKWH